MNLWVLGSVQVLCGGVAAVAAEAVAAGSTVNATAAAASRINLPMYFLLGLAQQIEKQTNFQESISAHNRSSWLREATNECHETDLCSDRCGIDSRKDNQNV
jgi:ATP-dependent protease ClpP protease subunit